MKKLITAQTEVPKPVLYGEKDAKHTLVGWGSTKGAILEAIEFLAHKGIKTNFLQITCLSPFPVEKVPFVHSPAPYLLFALIWTL